jgi:hypothetical protein
MQYAARVWLRLSVISENDANVLLEPQAEEGEKVEERGRKGR